MCLYTEANTVRLYIATLELVKQSIEEIKRLNERWKENIYIYVTKTFVFFSYIMPRERATKPQQQQKMGLKVIFFRFCIKLWI